LDALSDAENKVNALETLDNLPEEILQNMTRVIPSPSFARML
jgi:hypothetical protein